MLICKNVKNYSISFTSHLRIRVSYNHEIFFSVLNIVMKRPIHKFDYFCTLDFFRIYLRIARLHTINVIFVISFKSRFFSRKCIFHTKVLLKNTINYKEENNVFLRKEKLLLFLRIEINLLHYIQDNLYLMNQE